MDFKINIENGKGKLAFDTTDTLMNNIYLSLEIPKGTWWFNQAFGSELHKLRQAKDVTSAADDAVRYIKEALQWLLDTRRATAVDATAARVKGGLMLTGTVAAAVGESVPFSKFVAVGE